jgi:hypothetical protein
MSSSQTRDAVDFDSFPSPAFSHNDSTSRIDSPRTKAPITNALSGSVRTNLVPLGNSFEANVSAASRTWGISTSRSPSAVWTLRRRKPLRQPSLIVRPALIPGPAQPAVELVLNSPLDLSTGHPPWRAPTATRAGSHPPPRASSRSICSSISADGGTVRLTA